MFKKWTCIIGCALHYCVAGLQLAWLVGGGTIPARNLCLITSVALAITSLIVGIAVLKLNLEKLLFKFEGNYAGKWDKLVLFAGLCITLLIVAFEMVMVAIYFFRGVKMELGELLRFIVLPHLTIVHLAIGTGAYFAIDYLS